MDRDLVTRNRRKLPPGYTIEVYYDRGELHYPWHCLVTAPDGTKVGANGYTHCRDYSDVAGSRWWAWRLARKRVRRHAAGEYDQRVRT